jgi:hypothetical protein
MSYPVSMKIFTLLVVLFAASTTIAQTASPVRIHTTVATTQARETMHLDSRHNMRLNQATGAELPFTIVVDSLQSNVNDGKQHAYLGTITNRSEDTLQVFFRRQQDAPCGWTSSVCFGSLCFPATQDNAVTLLAPGQSLALTLDINPALSEHSDTSHVYITLGAGDMAVSSDTMLYHFVTTFEPSNPPIIFGWASLPKDVYSFNGGGLHLFSAILQHRACSTLPYHFSMQAQLPAGWTASYTVGKSETSTGALTYSFAGAGDLQGADRQKIQFKVTAPTLAKTDSAVIYLSVHPETSNPADSMLYKFTAVFNLPLGGVESNDEGAGLAVLNVWPNPVHASANLNFDIMTDRDGPAIAHVYDVVGSEVYTSTMDGLSVGENHVQLGGLNLPSGDYMIVIQQGKATSEAIRINYVK